MTRFWHAEEIEKLIELVSVRPCIWDPEDTDYTDPNSRSEAFVAIAKQMGLRTEVVRTKFKNLRSQYFRIYRNPMKRNSCKKWIHFDALGFLNKDYNKQIGDTGIMATSDQAEISNDDEVTTDNIIEEEVPNEFYNDGISEYGIEDLHSHLVDNEIKAEIETKIYKSKSQAQNWVSKVKTKPYNKHQPKSLVLKATAKGKDAHSIFGEHVANELRSLKHNKKLQQALKCAILKAIYETNAALVS